MFAVCNMLRGTSRLSGVPTRMYSSTIVSAPPEVRMATAEKMFALFCIGGSILISPMYFVPNFKNYQARKD